MQTLADQYPEVAQHIEALPDHIAEHAGSVIMRYTHEDMYTKTWGENYEGKVGVLADFSEVITDPEYDSSQLEEEAIAAAHAGKYELSMILLTGSESLHRAHVKLEDEGYLFGSTNLETDDFRDERETTERKKVYDEASMSLAMLAHEAKQKGNSGMVTHVLDALVVVQNIGNSNTWKDSNGAVRYAICNGLGDDLIDAVHRAEKLVSVHHEEPLSRSGYMYKRLLEFHTGSSLDKKLYPNPNQLVLYDDIDVYFDGRLMDPPLKDVVAAVASSQSWLTAELALKTWPDDKTLRRILSEIDVTAEPGSIHSPEYVYHIVEACPRAEMFDMEDPMRAVEIANLLRIDTEEVVDSLKPANTQTVNGKRVDFFESDIGGFAALSDKHRSHFLKIIERIDYTDGAYEDDALKWDPNAVSDAIDVFIDAGFSDPELAILIIGQESPVKFAHYCTKVLAAGEEIGLDPDETIALFEAYSQDMAKTLRAAVDKNTDPRRLLEKQKNNNLLIESSAGLKAEIKSEYQTAYGSQENYYIAKKSITLDSFPLLRERIVKTGIPPEIASAMFDSWATYDSFAFAKYRRESVSLDDETKGYVAESQANALYNQLSSLESFIGEYGITATKSIIDTFGIYNFARHDSTKLFEQYKAWQNGEPVKTVVVEARTDWNSYTGKQAIFVDEAGEGVFYFEANSARHTARVAVIVGQYERRNGREPNVKRFVVNGHGNSTSIDMGVRGEEINTEAYRKHAIGVEDLSHLSGDGKRTGVSVREVNDYKRHLGKNFIIILQSCGTAGVPPDGHQNLASTMAEGHKAGVIASDVTITGLTINSDGLVTFKDIKGKASGATAY